MTALWSNRSGGWELLRPAGFPDERTLHGLVEDAPELLPLSGSPRLVVVGREVLLGGGYADLLAVETSGRLAVIEIKLARNSEARRAIVAQVLTYAAVLHGIELGALERDILGRELQARGHETLAGAAASIDQEGPVDVDEFTDALEANLVTGAFRLVLVLDEAPPELVRLVGYLEAIAENLVIDLITVAAYEVGEAKIVVPQRVEPERVSTEPAGRQAVAKAASARSTPGADAFLDSIANAPEEQRAELRRLADWAIALERDGVVQLRTGHGKSSWTLRPLPPGENAGLVTIGNEGTAYLTLHRSVFERLVPSSIPAVEAAIGTRIGSGNTVSPISDEALAAIAAAYRTAPRMVTPGP